MAKLIIEVFNRLGQVSERHKYGHFPIKIGRGYENDLIVNDPYVCAQHLAVHEMGNGWTIEDLDSHNGIEIKTVQGNADAVTSGNDVVIGKTRLRFLSPSHPMGDAHPLPLNDDIGRVLGRWWIALPSMLMALLILFWNEQLLTMRDLPIDKTIASVLPAVMGALIWAGIWAFIGRVIKQQAYFLAQLVASLLFALTLVSIKNVSEYIAYLTSHTWVIDSVEILLIALSLVALFYVNLGNSTSTTRKVRLLIANGVAWSVLLFAIFMQHVNSPEFRHAPDFPSALKPPFAKIIESQPLDDFFIASERVFDTVANEE